VNSTEQDQYLLEGLAKENKQAIEYIYKNNYKSIQKLVLYNNGDDDDAADVFQEALVVLYEKSINPDFRLSCQIKTFLYSVAKRIWLKRLNTKNKFSALSEDADSLSNSDDTNEKEQELQRNFNLMEDALSKLGEPCRSLLEAYYLENKDMNQIAALFNYTNSDNAKTQKYKCMIRLKKLFFSAYKK
jgi:RNA polymerase sigma factor (sigma-70 family)